MTVLESNPVHLSTPDVQLALPAYELKQWLAKVKKVNAGRGALPVLDMVHIRANARGIITATVTDLEVTASLDFVADHCDRWELLVPQSTLRDIVRSARKAKRGETPELVTVSTCGELSVTVSRGGSVATVNVPHVSEWPSAVTPPGWPMRAGRLLVEHLRFLTAAASSDAEAPARPILGSVAMQSGHMVATDSYRLHVVDTDEVPTNDGNDALIPARALRIAVAIGSDAWNVAYSDRDAYLEDGIGHRIMVRMVEGEFPNWPGLFRSEPADRWTFSDVDDVRAALADAAKASRPIYRGGGYSPVTLEGTPEGIVLRVKQEGTTWERRVAGTTSAPYVVAYNPDFLRDAFDGLGPVVTLETVDAQKPGVVRGVMVGEDTRRLAMPVRIS